MTGPCPPIVAVDVHYTETAAHVGLLTFRSWSDAEAVSERTLRVDGVAPYQSGAFYRRELPPILTALNLLEEPPGCIVVDGYVWLSQTRKGLGQHLFEALDGAVAVIGVAKTAFAGNDAAVEVRRGQSNAPLFITACGLEAAEAAAFIADMHGPHRLPTLLKRVDHLARQSAEMPD